MIAVLANIWIPSGIDLRHISPELALVVTLAALLVVPIIMGRSSQTAAAIALITPRSAAGNASRSPNARMRTYDAVHGPIPGSSSSTA